MFISVYFLPAQKIIILYAGKGIIKEVILFKLSKASLLAYQKRLLERLFVNTTILLQDADAMHYLCFLPSAENHGQLHLIDRFIVWHYCPHLNLYHLDKQQALCFLYIQFCEGRGTIVNVTVNSALF